MSGDDPTHDTVAEDVRTDGYANEGDDVKDIHSGVVRRRQRLLSLSVPRKFFQNISIFSRFKCCCRSNVAWH